MTEIKEIKISDKQVIEEIEAIQNYIKKKGEQATETEIVQVCIRMAKRLSAGNWGVYLEVKRMHDKK